MVESALLAIAGGALGIAVSAVTVPLLIHLAPAAISRLADAQLDGRVLAFSMALSVATAFLFGLLPAIRASRIDLQASLHGEGRKTAHAPTSLARRLLVAADVAHGRRAARRRRPDDQERRPTCSACNPGFDADQRADDADLDGRARRTRRTKPSS